MKSRADLFRYSGLDVSADTLTGHYQLDGREFRESVTFEGVGHLTSPAVSGVAHLWYLIAGLSYYKAGAAHNVDLGETPVGPHSRTLFHAALHDGLGEFGYANGLPLDDVDIEGGRDAAHRDVAIDPQRVLVPFGGGIDSVVTFTQLNQKLERALFIVSPSSGRFAALEETAAVTGAPIIRATRTLDPQLLVNDERLFNGHVPVTAMVTLLAAVAAIASGRGGVVMSNEHSASIPNLFWHARPINHQWSKSFEAEELIANALAGLVGREFVAASFLRDRSELWVAQVFSRLRDYHHVFRSCNRAFTQDAGQRSPTWCGECDKCLFINLVLAPFLTRSTLRAIFTGEPLAKPELETQLRTLVGLGNEHKPFECVGDPDESAAALAQVCASPEWSDVTHLGPISNSARPLRTFDELLKPQGPTLVAPHWLR